MTDVQLQWNHISKKRYTCRLFSVRVDNQKFTIVTADDNYDIDDDDNDDDANKDYRLGLDGEACVNRLLCEVTAHPMVATI